MAYATIAHVKQRNPIRVYGASTKPSVGDLEGYLQQTAAILDGILAGRGFQVPVQRADATAAFELLQSYNADGAWAMAERAAESSPHRDKAEELWKNAQKMLRDGLIEPPGLPRERATGRARAVGAASPAFHLGMEL